MHSSRSRSQKSIWRNCEPSAAGVGPGAEELLRRQVKSFSTSPMRSFPAPPNGFSRRMPTFIGACMIRNHPFLDGNKRMDTPDGNVSDSMGRNSQPTSRAGTIILSLAVAIWTALTSRRGWLAPSE